MKRIVISEFMDAPAVESLRGRFEVDYRPALVDDAAALSAALGAADGWIVRNRTQVRGALLAAAARLRVVGRLGEEFKTSGGDVEVIRILGAVAVDVQRGARRGGLDLEAGWVWFELEK